MNKKKNVVGGGGGRKYKDGNRRKKERFSKKKSIKGNRFHPTAESRLRIVHSLKFRKKIF